MNLAFDAFPEHRGHIKFKTPCAPAFIRFTIAYAPITLLVLEILIETIAAALLRLALHRVLCSLTRCSILCCPLLLVICAVHAAVAVPLLESVVRRRSLRPAATTEPNDTQRRPADSRSDH